MNKFLIAIAAMAAASAMAATEDHQAAQPATLAASAAPGDECVRERVTTYVVNGKTVEVRKKERNPDPACHKQAARLWD